MGNFKGRALTEARRVVSDLIIGTSKGTTFQFEAFIQGLSEEIESLWESGLHSGIARFSLMENGDLVYEGIHTELSESPTSFNLAVNLEANTSLKNVDENSLDIFSLLSSMKESHIKEKSKILESLDQISLDFDKKLIEAIKKAKQPHTSTADAATKIAEEYLHLDIATKKQKLLEKLLEGK